MASTALRPRRAYVCRIEPAARICMSKLESGGAPATESALASTTTATSSRGSSSSSLTISWDRFAVDGQ